MPTADSPAAPVKIGLALSGGGFRASFFHIGVLSRLAETGVLRRVEVISTVSGGSIVGALYYIHVKNLLESKGDAEIGEDDSDYVRIMERIDREFRHGVQKNVRARAYADPGKNFRMAESDYSRSDRIGELYDELFYSPAWAETQPKRGRACVRRPIQMRELLIRPPDETDEFRPDSTTPRVARAVPVLLLNATTRSTPATTGASRRSRWARTAARDELARRLANRQEHAPGPATEAGTSSSTPIARSRPASATSRSRVAVAASACVPALFHPLAISNLFDGVRVELVDGGVHDNQGVCRASSTPTEPA